MLVEKEVPLEYEKCTWCANKTMHEEVCLRKLRDEHMRKIIREEIERNEKIKYLTSQREGHYQMVFNMQQQQAEFRGRGIDISNKDSIEWHMSKANKLTEEIKAIQDG